MRLPPPGRLDALACAALLLAALLACGGGRTADDAGAPVEQDPLRAKCGGRHPHHSDCKSRARAALKDPDSADFQSVLSEDYNMAQDCTETIRSYVRAKNSFGAEVRTDYMCTYDPKTQAISFQILKR